MIARLVIDGTREEVDAALTGPGPLVVRVAVVDVGEEGSLVREERTAGIISAVSIMACPLPLPDGAGPIVSVYIKPRQEDPTT